MPARLGIGFRYEPRLPYLKNLKIEAKTHVKSVRLPLHSRETFNCDSDAKLDAERVLATLPTRLIEIGKKRVAGEKLSGAERKYLRKERKVYKIEIKGNVSSVRLPLYSRGVKNRVKTQQSRIKRPIKNSEVTKARNRLPEHIQGLNVTCGYI